jgi:hypothetical protein
MRFDIGLSSLLILVAGSLSVGQEAGKVEASNAVTNGVLEITKTVASSDTTAVFTMPLQCDADGNVYLKSDTDGFPDIHKISPKGERMASFVPTSCSDIKVHLAGEFFVASDGRVYQVAVPPDGMQPFVLVFDDDGTCHSKIKLDTPFPFKPSQLVTFPSGNMLSSGMRWRPQLKSYMFYTALFSSSGTILKDIDFESDATTATHGDSAGSVKETEQEQTHSLSRGAMLLAPDNNAYLMRSGAGATIYAISEGGSVIRSFRVDAGESDVMACGMHLAGNRIAVLFGGSNASRALIKVVDLEGKPLAQYSAPIKNGRSTLSLTFACYSYPPEAFTFLDTTKDEKLVLQTVEPR